MLNYYREFLKRNTISYRKSKVVFLLVVPLAAGLLLLLHPVEPPLRVLLDAPQAELLHLPLQAQELGHPPEDGLHLLGGRRQLFEVDDLDIGLGRVEPVGVERLPAADLHVEEAVPACENKLKKPFCRPLFPVRKMRKKYYLMVFFLM